MAKKERKRRFITIELCPCLSDKNEARLKESIAQAILDLRLANNKSALFIPKVMLRTNFDNDSDIIVVSNRIIKP